MNEKYRADTVLNVLSLEDSHHDFEIIREMLIDAGFDLRMDRVETEKEFTAALTNQEYDIILADFKLPGFDAFTALRLSIDICPNVPFVCVSGTIGEDTAIELIKQGAHDYVLKDRPERLPFAIRRALDEAKEKEARRRAEEDLKENEKKYRLLADNVNDVIFVLDMNMNYTYVSPSVKSLRGYEPAEVLKQPSIETLTRSSWKLVMRTMSEVMELEKSGHREISISRTLQLEMRRKDGTTVWTEVKISFIRDEDQRPVGILGVTRDITERKRAEKELEDSRNMLIRSEKLAAIGQLSAGVAHEILNPINIMGMKLQMMEMTEDLSEKTKEGFKTCRDQIKRVTKICQDLNQFARVSEKQITPSNISELIEQVFSLMGPRIKVEDVKMDARYQPDLPLVPLDKDRMGQVILNLINNALDAMKGRPEKVLRVTTELKDKNIVRLSFSDTGTGIPPEILSRIFDPFFTTKEAEKGTGLGLSISYGIIQDHNGTIQAENNEQGGATFIIELPV